MASQHEHDVVAAVLELRRKLDLVPEGPAITGARTEFDRLVSLLGVVGYHIA